MTQTKKGSVVIVGLLALFVVPFAIAAREMVLTRSMETNLPHGSFSAVTFMKTLDDFPPGYLHPLYLVIDCPGKKILAEPEGILQTDNKAFKDIRAYLMKMSEEIPHLSLDAINSIMLSGGQAIPTAVLLQALSPSTKIPSNIVHSLKFLVGTMVNEDQSATVVEIRLPVDPLGDMGMDFITNTRFVFQFTMKKKHPPTARYTEGFIFTFSPFDRAHLKIGIVCYLIVEGKRLKKMRVPKPNLSNMISPCLLSISFYRGFWWGY